MKGAAFGIQVCSFDVFDTVLTRVYAEPEDVHQHFAEIAVARGWAESAQTVVLARREAERLAWQACGYRGAIDIKSVHFILAQQLGWPTERAATSMELEVDLEASAVRAVPEVEQRLARLRTLGNRLCFISDMHLSGHQVRAMLAAHGLWRDDEPVFVSSDVGLSKRAGGRLYGHAATSLRLRPWHLLHFGDDALADVRMARFRGVRARHLPQARLNRYELSTLARLPGEDWRSRSAVVASKFARLSPPRDLIRPEGPEEQRWALLCSTVAPLIAGYALWLIEQAQQRGIEALFFMARDMQIVHEVASAIVRERGLALRCVYIHASRAAWQPAAHGIDPSFDQFWMCDQPEDADPVDALSRVLVPDQIADLQQAGELTLQPGEDRGQTLHRWLRRPAVAKHVADETRRRRELLLTYLDQQGYRPNGRCALVDAGWRGTLQKCLASAYQARNSDIRSDGKASDGEPLQISAFYIGLRHRVSTGGECSLHAYLLDADVARLGYSLVALVEGFLTANHGSTLGYRRAEDGRIAPMLAADPACEVSRQWQEVRAASLVYLRELLAGPASCATSAAVAASLAAPFLLLCAAPARQEAELLHRWLFDTGRSTARLKPLVAPMSLRDLGKLVLATLKRSAESEVYLSGPWLRGTLAGLNPIARVAWLTLLRWPR